MTINILIISFLLYSLLYFTLPKWWKLKLEYRLKCYDEWWEADQAKIKRLTKELEKNKSKKSNVRFKRILTRYKK